MGLHLHIDPFAGIAGDMLLGACLDLGASLEDVVSALKPILPGEDVVRLTAEPTMRSSIRCVDFRVQVDQQAVVDHGHGHTHYGSIMTMIDRLDAPRRAKERASAVTTKLAEAEARVHNTSIDKVHFHEVGAIDSIVDMLGAAVALEQLDVTSVSCGPVPWPRGWVKCAHGKMPVPAPATAYLMEGMSVLGVDEAMEMVTPTGAAWLAAIVETWGAMPNLRVSCVGYGAGDRDTPNRPNALRLVLGEKIDVTRPRMQENPTLTESVGG